MNFKKSHSARLEPKRPALFLLGLCMSAATVLCAFEWRTPVDEKKSDPLGCPEILVSEETQIIHAFRPPERKKTPPAPKKQIIDQFKYSPDLLLSETTVSKTEDPEIFEISELPEKYEEEEVFFREEIMPSFPGGDSALSEFLKETIKYPPSAKWAGTQGRVDVSFIVGKDGSITDVKVLRGVSPEIDKETIRVINSMPPWKPGSNNGHPVDVRFVMPVYFRLN